MSFKDYKAVGEQYGVGGEGNWMKLEEGPNKIRLVTEFSGYGEHFDNKLNRSFICTGKETCSYCDLKMKPTVKFKGWAINRKDDEIKLLTIGYKIYSQIGELANSEEYGFEGIPNYDITITKTGQGKGTKYSTIPDRKDTKLTQEESDKINELENPEEIIERDKANALNEEEEIDVKKVVG